jgi:hypothetical protein
MDHKYTATEYQQRIDAESGPLVLQINEIVLVTPTSGENTTLVLNDRGRLTLKRLLGQHEPRRLRIQEHHRQRSGVQQ